LPQVTRNDTADCPACGTGEGASGGYILFCSVCGHRLLKRSEEEHRALEATTFTNEYAGYRPDRAYVDAVTEIARTQLVTRVGPPARLLDIGCGAGDFMAAAQTLGYDVQGIDISEASASICRSRNLNARAGDFLTCDFDGKFDLIVMWDVVAHLRNPADFLGRARSLLTDRGILFIKTPSFGDLSVRLSDRWPRLAGVLLGAPSHCQYFDRESLSALLSRTGFDAEWIDGGKARSPAAGGNFKRRAARRLRALVSRLSGDSNLYVAARSR
jgi:2-polyprenyl-3-methyl-5-hydroxy-6-metoxy-1,4-benzoquinol methylase